MQGANINQRKVNRGGLTHVPSPPWHGALIVAILALSLLILFSYTLLDWQWQQDRGNWNWVVAIGGMAIFARLLRAWHNDPRRLFTSEDPNAAS